MKIQIRYKNNRLDIFDTSSFTKPEPFDDANMLTNFEVRVDELGNTGLWLIAHHYEVSEAIAKTADEGETPVARRKRGWRFLLAESGELPDIESLSIDGQIMLARIAGELADMVRFEQMCELWLSQCGGQSITQRAVRLFDALCRAFPELSANDAAIARMCGFSKQAMDELRVRVVPGSQETEVDECDWLSEFFEKSDKEEA
ncbi:MAG: hypothetical protein ACLVC4_00800 [Gordonibacter urolithinfaciens]